MTREDFYHNYRSYVKRATIGVIITAIMCWAVMFLSIYNVNSGMSDFFDRNEINASDATMSTIVSMCEKQETATKRLLREADIRITEDTVRSAAFSSVTALEFWAEVNELLMRENNDEIKITKSEQMTELIDCYYKTKEEVNLWDMMWSDASAVQFILPTALIIIGLLFLTVMCIFQIFLCYKNYNATDLSHYDYVLEANLGYSMSGALCAIFIAATVVINATGDAFNMERKLPIIISVILLMLPGLINKILCGKRFMYVKKNVQHTPICDEPRNPAW